MHFHWLGDKNPFQCGFVLRKEARSRPQHVARTLGAHRLYDDLRSGVCFLLRRGSNTASSFLKARDKQPQVRLFTSIYDFTRIALDLYWAIR